MLPSIVNMAHRLPSYRILSKRYFYSRTLDRSATGVRGSINHHRILATLVTISAANRIASKIASMLQETSFRSVRGRASSYERLVVALRAELFFPLVEKQVAHV
jgi:hypothetical protein